MSANPVLNDEQWTKLLERVARSYNEVTLSRGFQYFKQQFVTSLNVTEDRVVHAHVTGSEDYKVTLYLDQLSSSSCTCPVHTACKHLAAVMMELADRWGYPASQLVNAQQFVRRAQVKSSAKLQPDQLPAMDVNGWHKMMESITASVRPTFDQSMYMDALRYQLQMMRKEKIPFSPMDRLLFDLHQQLFLLRKVKGQNAQSGVVYYTPFALYRMYDEVHTELRKKAAEFDLAQASERLAQTLRYIREQMAEDQGQKYLDYGLYTALWKEWIAPRPEASSWIEQELREIEEMTKEAGSPSLSAAQAFLYLHQSRSGDAWVALEEGGALAKAPGTLFLPFLDHLAHAGQWEELVTWLIKTASYFYGIRSKELEAYMAYWKLATEHDPSAEEGMWSVLEGMMPHSASMIEDLLYEQRRWKPWLELQIMRDQDPLQHRVSVLQPIEKETPELLLPYYHQAIEHYVVLKNRQDYKLAVKLLKRLEKVYKKMKQPERWDRFFQEFLERYSRLRALQEEIKRGKLVE